MFSELLLSVLSETPVSEMMTFNGLMWKNVWKLISQLIIR